MRLRHGARGLMLVKLVMEAAPKLFEPHLEVVLVEPHLEVLEVRRPRRLPGLPPHLEVLEVRRLRRLSGLH